MSNPAVFTLANEFLADSKMTIKIEDNIGEAIHIHFGDIRIDSTVADFYRITNDVRQSLHELCDVENFNVDNYDPVFLLMIAKLLPYLEKAEIQKCRLSDLQIVTRPFLKIPVVRGLERSRVYKALNGNEREQRSYNQENYRDQDNIQRMKMILKSVEEHGYPYEGEYIVLINDQMLIRDGQHRAACLRYLYGADKEIPVVRLYFKNNMGNASLHPWIEHFLSWDKKRVKKVLRMMKKMLKKVWHQFNRKKDKIVYRMKVKKWRKRK